MMRPLYVNEQAAVNGTVVQCYSMCMLCAVNNIKRKSTHDNIQYTYMLYFHTGLCCMQ